MFGSLFASLLTALISTAVFVFYRFCSQFIEISFLAESAPWLPLTLKILGIVLLCLVTFYLRSSKSGIMRFVATVALFPLYLQTWASDLFPIELLDLVFSKSSMLSLLIIFVIVLIGCIIMSGLLNAYAHWLVIILFAYVLPVGLMFGAYYLFKLALPNVIEHVAFISGYAQIMGFSWIFSFVGKSELQQ